jgi:hypothetical protein
MSRFNTAFTPILTDAALYPDSDYDSLWLHFPVYKDLSLRNVTTPLEYLWSTFWSTPLSKVRFPSLSQVSNPLFLSLCG